MWATVQATEPTWEQKVGSFSLIAVQPFRSGLPDVAGGVVGAGGNEQLFADPEAMILSIHLEFFFAFDEHHQFVGVMHEIFPYAARRVDPQITRKSASGPTLLDFLFIDR